MMWRAGSTPARSRIEHRRAITITEGDGICRGLQRRGRVLAVEDVCTHDGGGLTGGAVEGDQVICPRHGARFCLRTGEALSPPAYEPVRVFETKIEAGRIWIRADG